MKKRYILTIVSLIILLPNTFLLSQNISRQEYIETYKEIAIRQMRQFGIPASIILAQASLESGNGNSFLAINAKNHFGIKCHEWNGQKIYHDDDHKNECFRKYNSPEESFNDHSIFLRHRSRYSFLFEYDIRDYKSWAHGLKRAGYATNPQYAHLLIKIIEENQLYRFDLYFENLNESNKSTTINTIQTSEQVYTFNLERSVNTINGKEYILTIPGDTFELIANEFSLFVKELLRFNDLNRTIQLTPGTIVFLEKKGRKNKDSNGHIYNYGDSMYSISQKYGIRINRLYRINKMKKGAEPTIGTFIKLN